MIPFKFRTAEVSQVVYGEPVSVFSVFTLMLF